MYAAFDFKEEFDRSGNSSLSATIDVDWSIFDTLANELASHRGEKSRQGPRKQSVAGCSRAFIVDLLVRPTKETSQ